MKKTGKRLLAVALSLLLTLGSAAEALAADGVAATMKLTKTEGTVTVSSSSGKNVSIIDNMSLYNGYHVKTSSKSYAWISLDGSKMSKVDASSEISIRKNGKKLEILLESGNVFFNVTEPLKDDESLNIRTSTMVVGIRGTCGCVEAVGQNTARVAILEGTVEVRASDPVTGETKTAQVSGGESAVSVVYKQAPEDDQRVDIIPETYGKEDIKGYALTELAGDNALTQQIFQDSGIDLRQVTAAEAQRQLRTEEAAAVPPPDRVIAAARPDQAPSNVVWKEPVPSSGSSNDSSSGGSGDSGYSPPVTPPVEKPPKEDPPVEEPPAEEPPKEDPPVTPPTVQYTVTFDRDIGFDGGKVTTQRVQEGQTASRPSTPEYGNYTFIDWYTSAASAGNAEDAAPYDFSTPVTADLTLYAHWRFPCTIEFGGYAENQEIKCGGTVTKPEDPVREGYAFTGWFEDYGCTQPFDFRTPVEANLVLYAGWSLSGYVVTFDTGSGSAVPSQTITALNGGLVTRPETDPVWADGVFDGWYADAAYTTEFDFDTPVTSSVTVYAKWAYCVTFMLQAGAGETVYFPDGTNSVNDGISNYCGSGDTYGTATQGLAGLIRAGYSFLGWSLEPNGAVVSNTALVEKNVTLYARWEAVYTVTFDVNGGSPMAENTASVTGGGTVSRPADPTRTGYTFDDWYTDSARTRKFDFSEPVTGNLTLYAGWSCNVSFNVMPGAFPNGVSVSIIKVLEGFPADEGAVTGDNAPAREGYTLAGWYKDRAYTQEYSFDQAVSGSVTLYAKWEPVTYTVTFVTNGGTAVDSQTISYGGGAASQPAAPTRDGYTFVDWYADSACTQKYDFSADVNSDLTLYAKWGYTVTFYLNRSDGAVWKEGLDGYTVDEYRTELSIVIPEGRKLTDVQLPDENSITFSVSLADPDMVLMGWCTYPTLDPPNLPALFDTGSTVTSSLGLYGVWGYTVTLDAKNDEPVRTIPVISTFPIDETLVTGENAPVRAGYTFEGWYEDEAYTTQYDFTQTVNDNSLTLYAKWVYTITFNANDGAFTDGEKTLSFPVDPGAYASPEWVADPQRDGFSFAGWTINAGSGEFFDFDRTPITSDITLEAIWMAVSAP